MPYEIVFSKRADDDFGRIANGNPVAASKLLDQLEVIAADPKSHEKPSGLPYPPFPQFRFWLRADDQQMFLWIVVLFNYTEPQTLQIKAISLTEVGPDYPFSPDSF